MGLGGKNLYQGGTKFFQQTSLEKIKYSFRATAPAWLLCFFQRRHLKTLLNSSPCPLLEKSIRSNTQSKQEFMHISFLTLHTSTTLISLNSGPSPAVLDRQDFCTASIVSADTSTMGLWFLFSKLSFHKSIFCVNEQSRTRKNSPSAAEEIICRNCCLQVRMTDFTNSTDSICIINSKHNYIGMSTIPPDSAAITS